MKTIDPARTADGFAKKGAFAVGGNGLNSGLDGPIKMGPGPQGGRKKNIQETLDVEEDAASVGGAADNVSAGGTRYVVGLKGGLKFYGGASNSQLDAQDSLSQYSKNRGNPAEGEFITDN